MDPENPAKPPLSERKPGVTVLFRANYKASGHDGSLIELFVANAAFPGAVDAADLWPGSANASGIPLKFTRVPDDGYWSDIWLVKPSDASYWDGRPVQNQRYSSAYLSTADWNDTHFQNAEFDAMILQARAELDAKKRKVIYAMMAQILWKEGGVIVPMFNNFVDGYAGSVAGWVENPNHELTGGKASHLT